VDHHPFRFHLVDEPIWTNDQFTQVGVLRIRKPPTPFSSLRQRVPGVTNSLGKCGRERRRIAGYVFDGFDQVCGRRISPDYLASHFESRFLTSP
jgi:hypothetical protein